MKLYILLRSGVLGVALAGLMVTGTAARSQDKDAAKDTAKLNKDAAKDAAKLNKDEAKDAAKLNKDAAKDARKKHKGDKDPAASTNKTHGNHNANGHIH